MLHEKALELARSIPNSVAQPDFSGMWRNQMSSTMDLTVTGNDVLGIYTSAGSAAGGPVAEPEIRTLWHLVTNVPDADEPKELWTSTYAGADEFCR